jgi:hypothetical protein
MPIGLARSILTGFALAGGATRTPKTFTNTGITFDSGTKQFGTYSAYFDGADKCSTPNNSDFNLGTGPYTIEFWFNTADTVAEIVNQQEYGDNLGWSVGPRSSQRMLFAAGNNTEISVLVPSTGGWTDNTWAHVAVCKASGGGVAIFANGTRKYYSAAWNVDIQAALDDFFIGTGYGVSSGLFGDPGDGGTRGGYFYTGYLDELRISTVDRYGVTNSTITVPTAAFTNDADTVLLMHFDNDLTDDGGA